MSECAGAFLLGGVGGLDDEGCLDREKESGLLHRLSMIRLPRGGL